VKIAKALKLIDEGWVQKTKGFRVRFQMRVGSEWVTQFSPGEDDNPLDSDVTTWRLAWKLAQSTPLSPGHGKEGDMVNIHVVDEDGNQIDYYATSSPEIFNPLKLD
jgi:hypothetical protein